MRYEILLAALGAGKGHVPPAFSWVEIGTCLFYSGALRIDPRDPRWPARDRFLLSKGHACLTLYAILADLGFFSSDELGRFAKDGSMLAGHPDLEVPGAEMISGSLGHGLGVGAGLALSAQLDASDRLCVVLLGDGECQEGSVWEAAMFASQHKLDRLVAIVDRNRLGATDFTENTLGLEPFAKRWESFGWEVKTVDGHDLKKLCSEFIALRRRTRKQPLVYIANTVKGKGLAFMENSPDWHHALPKGEAAQKALAFLKREASRP